MWANVIEAVASLGPRVVPRIAKDLKDQPFRDKAVEVLARLGPGAKAAVPELIEALKVEEAEFRDQVAFTLAMIGPDASPAVPALIQSLSDENPDVCYTACYALGKIGPAAKAALAALMANLNSDDSFLRLASVWAMLRIQPQDKGVAQRAIPLLIEGLEMQDRELVRVECAAALGDIGSRARSAVPALSKALQDPSEAVRSAAAEALQKIDR